MEKSFKFDKYRRYLCTISFNSIGNFIFQERKPPFFINQYDNKHYYFCVFILVLCISILFSFFSDINMILSLGDLLFKCLVVCSDLLASFAFFSIIAFFLFFKIIVFFFAYMYNCACSL